MTVTANLQKEVYTALPKLGFSLERAHYQADEITIMTSEKQSGPWYTRHKITATFDKHSDLIGMKVETWGSKQVKGGRLPSEYRGNQAADQFLKRLREVLTQKAES